MSYMKEKREDLDEFLQERVGVINPSLYVWCICSTAGCRIFKFYFY